MGNLLVQQEEASGLDPAQTLILTDMEHAMLDFGKPTQRPIMEMSVEEAERYIAEGHFLPRSIGRRWRPVSGS